MARRKPDWDRLLWLVDRSEASINALGGTEIREFGRLYRRVAGDLAYVRSHSTNLSLLRFLNDLIARGHGVLYRHPRKPWIQGLVNLLREAAAAARRRRAFIWTAVLFTIASAAFAAQLVGLDRTYLEEIVPPEFMDALEHWKEGVFGEMTEEEGAAMTGFYLANNTQVTAMAAAGGLTFGLMSLYMLFLNGAILGAFVHEVHDVNALAHFGAGVLPHGVTELLGVFVAAGAGLIMAWALINPGRRTRAQSLRAAGKDTTLLVGLGICLIWIAAPIEAWFSHLPGVPNEAKYAVALLSLVFWLLYFTLCGRELDHR